MYTSVCVFSLLVIGFAAGIDTENQAKLRFYTKSFENYTEWPLDESHKMFSSPWYDSEKLFCVFAHGFTGEPEGPAVKAVTTALLKNDTCNVALLNWQHLASMALPGLLNSYLNWAVPNAIQLGADFAKTLFKFSDAGLDLNKTHFVGHSLGAHLFGVTGNEMKKKGTPLPWITGLDPAIGFDSKPPFLRLNPSSALFTCSVHSDPSKYGSKRELGFVNFWPNYRAMGPVKQPGCGNPSNSDTFLDEDLCNHHRAWRLFVDAMEHPGTLLGSHAKTFRNWKRYNKEQREATVLELGAYNLNAIPGSYYLITNGESPYGLGKHGL